MERNRINWGIIGCGDVAEVKSGPAFQQIENSNLIAVMRRDPIKAADFAARHGVPQWYANADDLLKNESINAVYIATPPSSHLELSLKALEKGKDIYLEKPMVLNRSEADILIVAAEQSECKITVAHYRRALPGFMKVKQLIDEGAIGEIQFAEIIILQPPKSVIVADTASNWRIEPNVSGGGYFFDLAPHQIDLMLKYFGDVEKAFGFGSNLGKHYDANDIVTGICKFKSGVHFTGTWAFNVNEAQKEDSCKIYGSDGLIEFSFYGEKVSLISKPSKTFKFSHPKSIQEFMIKETVDYFLGQTDINPCSIYEAAEVIDIMRTFAS